MKNNLKIFMLSGLLFLTALGSQTPSPQPQENQRSTRKRPRPPQQQHDEVEVELPTFTGDHIAASLLLQNYVTEDDPELASAAAATTAQDHHQLPRFPSPIITRATSPHMNSTINPREAKPWLYYTPPPEFFRPGASAAAQTYSQNADSYDSTASLSETANVAAAAWSSTTAAPALQPLVTPATESAVPTPAIQIHLPNTFPSSHRIIYPAIVIPQQMQPVLHAQPQVHHAAANVSSAIANCCGNQTCQINRITTKEMLLSQPPSLLLNPTFQSSACHDMTLHKIDGEPLGFILLNNASKRWGERLIQMLDTHGPKLFEYQDNNGKTTLHKLASNLGTSEIFEKLYEELDSFDAKDEQGHRPLYDLIEFLIANKQKLDPKQAQGVYKKIKILLARGATIDKKILKLATTVPYEGSRKYTSELLQVELQSRKRSKRNQDSLLAATVGGTSCGNEVCPLSKITTEEIALKQRTRFFEQPFVTNRCPNITAHKINGMPLGFVLLGKAYKSKDWNRMLIQLFYACGPKAFEYQDINNKTVLHKLIGSPSKSQIIKMLYQKLDAYDTLDQQEQSPLRAAVEYLKNNHDLRQCGTDLVYEKIQILLSRGATIDQKTVQAAESIQHVNVRDYVTDLLLNKLQSREQAAQNQDLLPATSASSATPQSSTNTDSSAATASSAPAIQAHSQDASVQDYVKLLMETQQKKQASGNPDVSSAAAAESVSSNVIATPQQLVTTATTVIATANSTAPESAAQTQEDDGGVQAMDMNEDE